MFYIGFRDKHHAQIGLARSKDGITELAAAPGQPHHPAGQGHAGTSDAVYKPYAIFDGKRWLLWYNGRQGRRRADRRRPSTRAKTWASESLSRKPLSPVLGGEGLG